MKGIFQKAGLRIPLDKIPPTVGLNIGRMDISNCRVIFWDLGGQIALRSIWEKYYSEAHGLMFVLDSADTERFEEAKAAMDSLANHQELSGVPLLLCANKQDLPTARPREEINDVFQMDKIGNKSREKKLQMLSALTCAGIEEGITWLVNAAVNNPDVVRAGPRP